MSPNFIWKDNHHLFKSFLCLNFKGADDDAVYGGSLLDPTTTLMVPMRESVWFRPNSDPLTRSEFLMILYDVRGVFISATMSDSTHTSRWVLLQICILPGRCLENITHYQLDSTILEMCLIQSHTNVTFQIYCQYFGALFFIFVHFLISSVDNMYKGVPLQIRCQH